MIGVMRVKVTFATSVFASVRETAIQELARAKRDRVIWNGTDDTLYIAEEAIARVVRAQYGDGAITEAEREAHRLVMEARSS